MAKKREIKIDHSYLPGGSDVSRKRVEAVVAKYDLDARGRETGRKNEPRSEEISPDETERALHDESIAFIGGLTRVAADEVTEAVNKIQAVMPPALDTALERANIEREVVEATDELGTEYARAYGERQAALRDRSDFVAEHQPSPTAMMYKTDTTIFWSTVALLVLLEAAFNAFLFAEMQEGGVIGGFVQAVAAGAANVLLGLACGFFGLRYVIHVKPALRLLGILLTALFMTMGLGLHLALGELREAIGHDVHAEIDFLIILKPWAWFHYTSVPPAVLFVLGVAAFVVAMLKGRGGAFGIASIYPNFDSVDRRFQKADNALMDAEDDVKDGLANAFDGGRASLRERHAADLKTLTEVRALANQTSGAARTLSDSITQEIGRNHIWLQIYRDANRAVRTSKAPSYFAEYPDFAEWRAARLDLTDLKRALAAAEERVAENAAKLVALEQETLRDQVATIQNLLGTIRAAEDRADQQAARDNWAFRRPAA